MRWLALALALGACGESAPRPEVGPDTCQIWIYPPGLPAVLWTCRAGVASDPVGLPCVADASVRAGGFTLAADGTYHVADCRQCTPAELIRVDPWARCTPRGGDGESPWPYAPDGGEDMGR